MPFLIKLRRKVLEMDRDAGFVRRHAHNLHTTSIRAPTTDTGKQILKLQTGLREQNNEVVLKGTKRDQSHLRRQPLAVTVACVHKIKYVHVLHR